MDILKEVVRTIPDNPRTAHVYMGSDPTRRAQLVAALRVVDGKVAGTWHNEALREDFAVHGVFDGIERQRMLFPEDGAPFLATLARNLSHASFVYVVLDQDPLAVLDHVVACQLESKGIRLPLLHGITKGSVQRGGWSVQWVLRARRGVPFLDYYAQHRMTSSGHVRIHANGKIVPLPCENHAFEMFHIEGDDAVMAAQERYRGRRERIWDFLASKFPRENTTVPLPEPLRQFVDTAQWTFAKTYANTWPHEYVVRNGENNATIRALAQHILHFGIEGRFYDQVGRITMKMARCTGSWTKRRRRRC